MDTSPNFQHACPDTLDFFTVSLKRHFPRGCLQTFTDKPAFSPGLTETVHLSILLPPLQPPAPHNAAFPMIFLSNSNKIIPNLLTLLLNFFCPREQEPTKGDPSSPVTGLLQASSDPVPYTDGLCTHCSLFNRLTQNTAMAWALGIHSLSPPISLLCERSTFSLCKMAHFTVPSTPSQLRGSPTTYVLRYNCFVCLSSI